MTRLYATVQLLVHGALPFHEFQSVTGWSRGQCQRSLRELQSRGRVFQSKRSVWALKTNNPARMEKQA